jgi:dephospho-CoA kinase
MKLIGLTGGIATGKSTVSSMIRALGLRVIDADILAREVVVEGSFGLKALVQFFGNKILSAQELNRKALAQTLFGDPDARRVIENIIHPLIQWRAKREIELLRQSGERICFYDAALIFEKQLSKNFEAVIVVHTDPQTQIRRLSERDKIGIADATERLKSQMPIEAKCKEADYLIDNSRSLKETESQVKTVVEELLS